MATLPLTLTSAISSAQGADIVAADQAILAAIGSLSSPDVNAVTSKLTSLLSSVGNKTLADSLINFLSLIRSTLGTSADAAATSPTSTANIIPILKLISSYLQLIVRQSGTATQTLTAVAVTSGPIIASGAKNMWTISNYSANTIWLGYGKAAVVNSGYPIFPNTCWIDEFNFTGIVNGLSTVAGNVESTIFTI